MSGYRDRNGFEPLAGDGALPSPPTWVQRIGVACLFVGALIIFAYLGGQWGLIPKLVASPITGTIIVVMAGPLIGAGARRDPLSPEANRRRTLIVTAAVAVCALAAAATFYFQGAH